VRSELFEYGLLPFSPHSDISFTSLLAIVRKYRNTHELNAQYLKAINTLYSTNTSSENVSMRYSEWETIAAEDLLMCSAQTRVYFERFCMVRDNLIGAQLSSRKPLPIDRREVNFYEFIIYLYIQLAVQPSFGQPYAKGARFQSAHLEPSADSSHQRPTSRSGHSQLHIPTSAREHRDHSVPVSARKGGPRRKVHPEASPRPSAPTRGEHHPAADASGGAAPAAGATTATISNASNPIHRAQSPPKSAHSDAAPNPTVIPALSKAISQSPRGGSSPRSPKLSGSGESKRKSTAISGNSATNSATKGPSHNADLVQNRINYSTTSIPLAQHLSFVQDHLGNILRLLCADDPSCNVKRSELEPLNFLLAVAHSNYAVLDANLIDILPKASTTERYSRLDLTEWILLRLKVNTHLYSPNPSDYRQEAIEAAIASYPSKNVVKRPVSVIGVHQQTILRADPESIPTRGVSSDFVIPPPDNTVDHRFAHIRNCNSSYIYMLCPVSCIKVQHCTESIVVVGAVGNLMIVENCKDTTIITACKTIQISNCENCTFYLMTPNQPVVLGSNYNLQFGPYCTHYRSLDRHVAEAGLDVTQNLWNQPLLYLVELLKDNQPSIVPIGSSRHALKVAISKLEKQTYSLVPPDNFSPFRVPFELHGPTKQIPFPLPSDYQLALEDHTEEAILLKKELDRLIQDKKRQAQVQLLVRTHFEKWLAETGAMQQIEDLVKLQIQ
jgi:hypothetical protein